MRWWFKAADADNCGRRPVQWLTVPYLARHRYVQHSSLPDLRRLPLPTGRLHPKPMGRMGWVQQAVRRWYTSAPAQHCAPVCLLWCFVPVTDSRSGVQRRGVPCGVLAVPMGGVGHVQRWMWRRRTGAHPDYPRCSTIWRAAVRRDRGTEDVHHCPV